jgi:hypothetical protein
MLMAHKRNICFVLHTGRASKSVGLHLPVGTKKRPVTVDRPLWAPDYGAGSLRS